MIRTPFLFAALSIGVMCSGCGRDESDSATESSAAEETKATASTDENPAAEGDQAPDAETAAPAAKAPTIPTPDVATHPSIDGEPTKMGFLFYIAKEKPAPIAEFHKKELEAKGWKLGRNDSTKLAGTTLTGVIQEYTKGNDLVSVVLTEQLAGDGTMTMVNVLDIPLPPKTAYAVMYGAQANLETGESPDELIAWMTKEWTAHGWTAKKPTETAGTKSIGFTKGGRSISANIRASGPGKPGSSVGLMHIAYAE